MPTYHYSDDEASTQYDEKHSPRSNGHTKSTADSTPTPDRVEDLSRKKIILCFDGTTNSFQGDDSDTNVVKLFEMFDRLDKSQYHYYQPGIGTYVADASVQNVQPTNINNTIKKKTDEMFASSFADHVLGGYKFLMRYYMENDQVYIWGFSRGAYTARFLTEMLDQVGLLSKGNEELLPFLYYHYSDWRRNCNDKKKFEVLNHMSQVFCRKQENQKFVFWLGLWDCVNSVAKLSHVSELANHADASPNIAYHIRHAVSCHERRVMFKPTLFLKEDLQIGTCVETWFAGNHGDVGGGWQPVDHMQLSDISLIWMVEELRKQEADDLAHGQGGISMPIKWRETDRGQPDFKRTYTYRKENLERGMSRIINRRFPHPDQLKHDPLSLRSCGSGIGAKMFCAFWWTLELLPLAHTRLELKRSKNWKRVSDGQQLLMVKQSRYIPVLTNRWNRGKPRRIPLESSKDKIHPSVEILYKAGVISSMFRYGGNADGDQYRYFDPKY